MLTQIGLILNFVGAIMVAVTFGPYPDKSAAPYTGDADKKKYMAYLNRPKSFKWGIILIILGFLLQFIGTLY